MDWQTRKFIRVSNDCFFYQRMFIQKFSPTWSTVHIFKNVQSMLDKQSLPFLLSVCSAQTSSAALGSKRRRRWPHTLTCRLFSGFLLLEGSVTQTGLRELEIERSVHTRLEEGSWEGCWSAWPRPLDVDVAQGMCQMLKLGYFIIVCVYDWCIIISFSISLNFDMCGGEFICSCTTIFY